MLVSGSTYSFSLPCLDQLSRDLATPDFVPSRVQKVILDQALRLLDLELSYQAAEHPELIERVNQWLEAEPEAF